MSGALLPRDACEVSIREPPLRPPGHASERVVILAILGLRGELLVVRRFHPVDAIEPQPPVEDGVQVVDQGVLVALDVQI